MLFINKISGQLKKIIYSSVLLAGAIFLINSCIEPYEFVVEAEEPGIVIEGFISDASFDQTLQYPSDGRYFQVNLSYSNDVVNVKAERIFANRVELYDHYGNAWMYMPVYTEDGPSYILYDDTFKAEPGTEYKLRVIISDAEIFESDWVSLPDVNEGDIGSIGFNEIEKDTYVYIAGEEEIRTIKGMNVKINVPPNNINKPIYYKWTYDPTWIYEAPLASTANGGQRVCWAKNKYFLNEYHLQEDYRGDYEKELFFIPTEDNEKIYKKLSVLFVQQVMNKDYFYFWQELKDKNSGNSVYDRQPYNLATNFLSIGTQETKVYGYFGAVKEQATRWYFDKDDLSYYVDDDTKEDCLQYQGPDGPARECLNCLEYSRGTAFPGTPDWWMN